MKNIHIYTYILACMLLILTNSNAQPTTWTATGIGGGGALYSPSINPANPNEIYMGCDMTELFHTTNQGATWTEKPFQQIQGGLYSDMQYTQDPMIRYCINHAAKDNVDKIRPFKSDDGGVTWYPLISNAVTSSYVVQLFADYNSPSRVVLADYYQLFFSLDGGATFTTIYQTAASTIGNHIAGVCFDGNSIYICCENGIYYSSNNGATWSWMTTDGIPTGEKILSFTWAKTGSALKFVCLTATRVWAGIRRGSTYWGSMLGVFTMSNADGHWIKRTTGISAAAGDFVAWLGMAQNDTSTVYAAGGDGYLRPIVMKSVNSQAWTHTFLNTTNQNITTGWAGEHGDGTWDYGSAPQGFQVCSSNPNIVVTTDLGFTHITTDGGATWRQMYLNSADQNPSGAWTPRQKRYHSVGLENTGSWYLTWLDAQNIMASYTDIRGINSSDGGNTWKFTSILENTTYKIVKHATTNKVYAATSTIHDMYQSTKLYNNNIDAGGGKIYVSTDNGANFSVLKDFLHPIVWIETDPTDPSVLYASVIHSDLTIGGIYKTSDLQNGTAATWTKLPNPTRANGHPFNIRVLNNGDLAVTYSGHVPLVTDKFQATSGVFYFEKTSQTWTDRSHANMRFWTKDLVIDPSDPTQSTWYGCVFQGWGDIAMQGTGGLYRTRDKGLNWTKISNEFRVNSVSIHPTHPNIAYYTTETNGLWYSSNAQATTPTFTQVANYTFRHPMRVFFNPYNLKEVWITSFGNGMKHGIDNSITVLPIELLSFTAKKINNSNLINWETISELNTDNFELQRLNTHNNFETMSTIKANNKASNYLFIDDKTSDKTINKAADKTADKTSARLQTAPTLIDYYRLKINDFDGKSSFSKTISVENGKNTEGVKIYPNPANNVLFIENAEGINVEIVNILGQKIKSFSPNSNQFPVLINELNSGIYFIKIEDELIRFVKN
jgi:hypothetical protein